MGGSIITLYDRSKRIEGREEAFQLNFQSENLSENLSEYLSEYLISWKEAVIIEEVEAENIHNITIRGKVIDKIKQPVIIYKMNNWS